MSETLQDASGLAATSREPCVDRYVRAFGDGVGDARRPVNNPCDIVSEMELSVVRLRVILVERAEGLFEHVRAWG